MSQDLQILKKSDNPKDRGIADLLTAISEMRTEQTKLAEGMDKGAAEKISGAAKRLEHLSFEYNDGYSRRRVPMRHMLGMLPELLMEDRSSSNDSMVVAFAATLFKEAMPWVYEIGMEAYRQITFGEKNKGQIALKKFREAARLSGHPMAREFMRGDKESMLVGEEVEHLLLEFEHRMDNGVVFSKAKKTAGPEKSS